MSQHHNIPPIYDKDSRILILGSFPSVESRSREFFYAHQRNRFWTVIAAVLGKPVPVSVESKKLLLKGAGIALWDVLASCEIKGSSDVSIKAAVPNDITGILRQADIRAIYCNGTAAYDLYNRYIKPDLLTWIERRGGETGFSANTIENKGSCGLSNPAGDPDRPLSVLANAVLLPSTSLANAILLPSTSPANAAWSEEALINAWRRILTGLNMKRRASSYYSLSDHIEERYGKKLYKLSLDGGFTCPNRDGTVGRGGCIFCSEGGSGDFSGVFLGDNNENYGELPLENLYSGNQPHRNRKSVEQPSEEQPSVEQSSEEQPSVKLPSGNQPYEKGDSHRRAVPEISLQLKAQKELVSKKLPRTKKVGYIAYFQAFTGTYAPCEELRERYYSAISDPEVDVISIATRPDCLPVEVLDLLGEINRIKPVWIELGLQTSNEKTAGLINRGYPLKEYDKAVRGLIKIGIEQIITHVIIGLPGEGRKELKKTVEHIVRAGSSGIKLQLLHVIRGTPLEKMYERAEFDCLGLEEYGDRLCECVRLLPPDMVVHRLTGDGDKRKLIAPLWSGDKKRVINYINGRLNPNDDCDCQSQGD